MKLYLIFSLITAILGALCTGVPIFYKWNKARKNKNVAEEKLSESTTEAEIKKAEAEKLKAELEMNEQAKAFIQMAETSFNSFDRVLKAQNHGTAGAMKKENVLTKLQAFALSKGYDFDCEFWSNKIDEIVNFTKSVNSKN
jgi:hypothetical protein